MYINKKLKDNFVYYSLFKKINNTNIKNKKLKSNQP